MVATRDHECARNGVARRSMARGELIVGLSTVSTWPNVVEQPRVSGAGLNEHDAQTADTRWTDAPSC
jgi:hypothetical protein